MSSIYTETPGATCYLDGERGSTTGFISTSGLNARITGAFVQMVEGGMRFVELGNAVGERGSSHEVRGHREIDRDEFDRLNGIDLLRGELGWAG